MKINPKKSRGRSRLYKKIWKRSQNVILREQQNSQFKYHYCTDLVGPSCYWYHECFILYREVFTEK